MTFAQELTGRGISVGLGNVEIPANSVVGKATVDKTTFTAFAMMSKIVIHQDRPDLKIRMQDKLDRETYYTFLGSFVFICTVDGE